MRLFVDKIRTILPLQNKQKKMGGNAKNSALNFPKLIGIEHMTYIEVEGIKHVYAISDEDLECETDAKTNAVHFFLFELNEAAKQAIKYGAVVKLGCDHPNYNMCVVIPLNQLESLREDLN